MDISLSSPPSRPYRVPSRYPPRRTAVFLSLSLCTGFIHLPGINFNQVFTF